MPRIILDSIGALGVRAHAAVRLAMYVQRILEDEGPQVVSLDSDGKVYATPHEHPFSRSLLSPQYLENLVGSYQPGVAAEDIADDLRAAHGALRREAA